MKKQEAIDWANHFPNNKYLWFGVIKFNKKYIVYSSNHFKKYPNLIKEIIYKTIKT